MVIPMCGKHEPFICEQQPNLHPTALSTLASHVACRTSEAKAVLVSGEETIILCLLLKIYFIRKPGGYAKKKI